jgi:hypothetical protein
MTPEEKKAVQVALSLKYAVKKATCSCCSFEEIRALGEPPRSEYRLLCGRTKEIVHRDDVCSQYSPPRLRGKRAKMIMLDEISPVPENHKHSWRNIPS